MSANPQAQNNAATQLAEPLVRHADKIRKLGIVELVLGSLVFVVGIVSIVLVFEEYSRYFSSITVNYFTYSPFIWCAAVAITTGILGVRLPIRPIKTAYLGNMIMGIICAIISFAAMALSASRSSQYSGIFASLAAVHAMMALLNVALMVLSIAHAALCCGGVRYEPGPASVPQQTGYAQPQTGYAQQQNVMGAPPASGQAADKMPVSMA